MNLWSVMCWARVKVISSTIGHLGSVWPRFVVVRVADQIFRFLAQKYEHDPTK